jgi:hypothetical protein
MEDLRRKSLAGDVAAGEKITQIRLAMGQLGVEGQKELKQALTGFVGAGKNGEALFRRNSEAFRYASDPMFRASKFLDTYIKDNTTALFGTQAKLGNYNDQMGDYAEQLDQRNKVIGTSYEELERLGKLEIENQKGGADKGVAAQVGMRQEQMSATKAMQSFINLGINPTTVAMQKLSGAVESVTTKIPGAKGGTSGTGRGNEAGPGFFGRGASRGAGTAAGNSNNAQRAMAYFISQGYTPAQAAGIVGNLQAESGTNLDIGAVGDGGKAKGIAQWHPDRQANFAKFAGKSLGKSTLEEQLAFIAHELKTTEAGAGSKLRGASSAQDAATIIDQYYERSSGAHRQQRINNAQALLGQAPVVSSSSSSPGTLFGVPVGSASMSGPNDAYKPAISGTAPETRINNVNAEGVNQALAGKNSADLQVITLTKLDEMIALQKTNNTQNQKLLQVARN